MPTYGYRCHSCGHEFDEVQSIKAKALKICPQCKKPELHRVISSNVGIIFKGSGFYQTDYKKSHSSSPEQKSSTNEKPQGTTAAPAKPETPAAPKSDAPKKA
jgi:putative FmdB family regulatory protein